MLDLLIINAKLINYNNIINSDIGIKDEKIEIIGNKLKDKVKAKKIIDAKGKYIFPGVIDPHTHFQLKLTTATSKDDFYKGSIAAAFGGVTTFIDFTDPHETDLKAAFKNRLKEAKDSIIDYSLHSVIVNWHEERIKEVEQLLSEGINSFKIFTTYSETKRDTNDYQLLSLLRLSKNLNFILQIHAENDILILNSVKQFKKKNKYNYKNLSAIRSSLAEALAINTIGFLSEITKASPYIVHLSSALGLNTAKRFINKGVNIHLETCPHYISLTDDVFSREDGYLYSLCPPLRSKKDNLELINGIKEGYIKYIGTDHCPFTITDKTKGINNLDNMPYGISGVETLFYIIYNELHIKNKLPLEKIAEITSYNTAKLFNLKNKGSLQVGKDADLFIFNPDKKNKISYKNLHSNIDYSVYEGYNIKGDIETVILRGKILIENKQLKITKKGNGKFIKTN